jgi:hypothetical protein
MTDPAIIPAFFAFLAVGFAGGDVDVGEDVTVSVTIANDEDGGVVIRSKRLVFAQYVLDPNNRNQRALSTTLR